MTRLRSLPGNVVGPIAACVLAFLAGAGAILAIGKDPVEVFGIFISRTLGTWYGIGQVLFKATPLMFTGLSAAIGFRAGLFNVGADGQLAIGALCTAACGCLLPPLPYYLHIPLCLAAGMVAGGLWGAIPGILKARFGAHEVINTIMMNFVAAAVVSYVINSFLFVPATLHTPPIAASAELPRLDALGGMFRGSPVNSSLLIALLCCGFYAFLLAKTRFGYELRAVGFNPAAADYARIPVARRIVGAMTLAGAFAGLVGSNFVLGYKHYYELGFADGVGFIGIAVALVGKNHPAGIVLASLFFGLLEYGGLTINGVVPKELVNIVQAVVILFVIVADKLVRKRARRLKEA